MALPSSMVVSVSMIPSWRYGWVCIVEHVFIREWIGEWVGNVGGWVGHALKVSKRCKKAQSCVKLANDPHVHRILLQKEPCQCIESTKSTAPYFLFLPPPIPPCPLFFPQVNNVPVTGVDMQEVLALIKGPEGSDVHLHFRQPRSLRLVVCDMNWFMTDVYVTWLILTDVYVTWLIRTWYSAVKLYGVCLYYDMCIYTYTCTHAKIHRCHQIYIQTYLYTYIDTYINACIHAYIHTCPIAGVGVQLLHTHVVTNPYAVYLCISHELTYVWISHELISYTNCTHTRVSLCVVYSLRSPVPRRRTSLETGVYTVTLKRKYN